MRLDLFLKLSRLCPRRTIAQKLCEAGFVLLNGRPAKSAHLVNPNDLITIRRGDLAQEYRVRRVPDNRNVSKRESAELAEAVSQKHFETAGE